VQPDNISFIDIHIRLTLFFLVVIENYINTILLWYILIILMTFLLTQNHHLRPIYTLSLQFAVRLINETNRQACQ